jgi:predicted O-methyltransferase YrrM
MIDRNTVLNCAGISSDINEYLMTIYNLVVQGNYKTVVELGCGYSTVALTAAVNKTAGQLYSFDIGSDGPLNRSGLREELLKEPRFHFKQGDDMEIVKTWQMPIDFLFLDTSHLYEHTKAEIAEWFPFVKSGGVIACHDSQHEAGDGMGMRKALDEFLVSDLGKQYKAIFLLDTKILGMAILLKL